MSSTKAIGPEFRGVFEKIENQADEYVKAFNEINKFLRDSDRIKRENQEMILKCEDLYQRNSVLCNKLEEIESYIDKRMNEAVEEIIKYFEENIINEIIEKANKAISNFENDINRIVESVEGTYGLNELVAKLREVSQTVGEKIASLDGEKENLRKARQEITTDLKNEIKTTIDKSNSQLKSLQQEIDNFFVTTTFNIEDKLKKELATIKSNQMNFKQKFVNISKKSESFLTIGQKLEKNITKILETNVKQISDINTEFDELKERINNLEKIILKIYERKN